MRRNHNLERCVLQFDYDKKNIEIAGESIDFFTGEFWTSKQRQANSLHEISYRACFKPQLPNFFIKNFTNVGDTVYDPFGGRGTTVIEAALLGRNVIQNDLNPLSEVFAKSRLFVPTLEEVNERLNYIETTESIKSDIDLSMFFEKNTLSEIINLRKYLSSRLKNFESDFIDDWIRAVATNRLTGHSKGFFSVYTFPPNQAVSAKRQIKINKQRNQIPEYRDIKALILKKSKQLMRDVSTDSISQLKSIGNKAMFLNSPAHDTSQISDSSVNLVVTSPPFLDIVHYKNDNWLRNWFNEIDITPLNEELMIHKEIEHWNKYMNLVFKELKRVIKNNGVLAFEVGEIRKGRINLDEHIIPIALENGFHCLGVMINSQIFTKTSNIWGVKNNNLGTNSNRIIVLQK
jgi:DNA modification methylase